MLEVVLLMVSSFWAAVAVLVVFLVFRNKNKNKDGGGGGGGGGGGNGNGNASNAANAAVTRGGRGWQKANATYYYSYPPCCKDGPNYDPSYPTTECSDYSGCRWAGWFAGIDGQRSLNWVKNRNIAAVFTTGQTMDSWRRDWSGKKIQVREPGSGRTLTVTVVDTCGDSDCGNCCTKNATANGGSGVLIDLEIHTARRLFGTTSPPGLSVLEWKRV